MSAHEDASSSAYARSPGYTQIVGDVVEYDGPLYVERISDVRGPDRGGA